MKHFPPRLLVCLLPSFAVIPVVAQQSRTVSDSISPLVQINFLPPAGTSAWTVEESLSAGAAPVDISSEGVFDMESGKVKWGPFLDDAPRTLSYRIAGPAGEVTVDGHVSYDGSSEPVDTMDAVTLPDPETHFSGWRYLNLPGYLLHTLAAHPLSDMNLNGFTLFQEYAFGLFAPDFVDGPVYLEITRPSGSSAAGDLFYFRNRLAADLEFVVQKLDSSGGWIPANFEGLGIAPVENMLPGTEQVIQVVYPAIPLAALEGDLLRVQVGQF